MYKIVLEIADDRVALLGAKGTQAMAKAYEGFLKSGLADLQADIAAGTMEILKVAVRVVSDDTAQAAAAGVATLAG